MDEKTVKLLSKPFEDSMLKTRKGKSGMTFTYVDGACVVERLNQAFGHVWSWEVLESAMKALENGSTDVRVRGRLTVVDGGQSITKDAWGGVLVQPRGMDCEADMLKAASTDALKKAASLLGVALHLYSDEVGAEPAPAATTTKPPASKGGAATKAPAKPSGAQSAQIETLLRSTGMPEEILSEKVRGKYGCALSALTAEQAASVITYLEGVAARGRAA